MFPNTSSSSNNASPEIEVKRWVNIKEMFHWAVMPGLALLLLELVLGHTVWRKLP